MTMTSAATSASSLAASAAGYLRQRIPALPAQRLVTRTSIRCRTRTCLKQPRRPRRRRLRGMVTRRPGIGLRAGRGGLTSLRRCGGAAVAAIRRLLVRVISPGRDFRARRGEGAIRASPRHAGLVDDEIGVAVVTASIPGRAGGYQVPGPLHALRVPPAVLGGQGAGPASEAVELPVLHVGGFVDGYRLGLVQDGGDALLRNPQHIAVLDVIVPL